MNNVYASFILLISSPRHSKLAAACLTASGTICHQPCHPWRCSSGCKCSSRASSWHPTCSYPPHFQLSTSLPPAQSLNLFLSKPAPVIGGLALHKRNRKPLSLLRSEEMQLKNWEETNRSPKRRDTIELGDRISLPRRCPWLPFICNILPQLVPKHERETCPTELPCNCAISVQITIILSYIQHKKYHLRLAFKFDAESEALCVQVWSY